MFYLFSFFLATSAYAGPKEAVAVHHEDNSITYLYAWFQGYSNKGYKYQIYEEYNLKQTILCKDALCVLRKPSIENNVKVVSLTLEELEAIKNEWSRANLGNNSACRK